MADLAPRIQALCDDHARKLKDLHDDYVQTRRLWRTLLVRVNRYHENPVVRNPTTGTITAGAEWVAKAPASLQRLASRSFKDIVAQFELFIAELLRLWLANKPELIQEKAISVATLLASRDLADAQAAAIREAVESTIADRMYGRPEKWFNYLKKNLGAKIDVSDESSFVEMKARRDVLEHHSGVIEATYQEKTKAGAKYKLGEHVRVADGDVDEAYKLVQRLIKRTTADAIAAV